ncbi:sugar phosphate nucleotidyltransferase [Halorubrum sp. AD140]|uniref:sugar phosphate nucleotidyltransferase n=1 Tax=Halorubrum sp. AD140 TaxID=3050073 RepID=UPI002ACC43A8|nr:sugar phosphate nucleotidyltransferase [Halorubrum sp. AD140]MDZ5810222.1 sugar phosphate nucleotidyltransferase [Halorubrum sp. AD140]
MQVVILAAGRGTRMGPLTESMPKPMLPVADRPLVAHVADAAVAAGASELVFTVGYGGDRIREHFGDRHAGVPVRYAAQPEQRGTADAVRVAADHVEGAFAVLNGDSLYRPADLARLFEAVPAVGAARVNDPSSYGVLASEDGVVTEVVEKPSDPPSDTINAGAYAFPEAVVDFLDVPESDRGELELTDALDRVISGYDVTLVPFDDWMDVGRPWELLEANERRLPGGDPERPAGVDPVDVPDRAAGTPPSADGPLVVEPGEEPHGTIHPDATVSGSVTCEPGVEIRSGVVVDGPVRLRSGATVGPNAYVRGPTLVGPGARIGHAVEVKSSVVMADARIGHLSYVGDSVVGPNANLGAGTNVANLRHDGEPVALTVCGERVSTDRRKFGTVIGPDVKTGIQTGINPGVTLSAGSTTEPGEIVTRDR